MEYESNRGGYSKRPLWQWIILYVIIGGALYGLVYYFIFAKNGNSYNSSYSYGSTQTATQPQHQLPEQPSQPATSASAQPSTPVAPPSTDAQTHVSASAPVQMTPVQTASSGKTVTPQSFTVNGNDESADLTTITVPKGTRVTIMFGADADGTYHGGLDFRSSVVNTGTIAPGSTKTVSFVADNSFSFTPYWPATNIAKPYQIHIVVE